MNLRPGVARRAALRPKVRLLALAVAGGLSLAAVPGGAFAGASATASPSPSASTSPTPTSSPAATPAPSATPSASPSASASPSPAAKPNYELLNKEAESQAIGDLTAAEAHALMLEKSLNQAELGLMGLGQQIVDAQKQVSDLDGRLAMITEQHGRVSAQLVADRIQLEAVVRQLYKHQDNFVVSLIQAGGFGGLLQVLGYSDVVVDREHSLINTVQADEVSLAHAQTTLQRTRSDKQKIIDQLVVTRATLAQEIANEQNLQTQLQGSIDAALAALDAMQSDTPAQAAERARLLQMKTESILNQIEQAVFASGNFAQTAQLIAQDPVLSGGGKLLVPLPHATITQGFGPTSYAFEAAYAGFPHFHTGLDLADPLGTPVFAAADGVVALAQSMTDSSGALVGYGNYVLIDHGDGLQTLYGHLLAFAVKPGDMVKRGQLIGMVGSTGNSTGPHTHFEVRVDNSPVDPMQFLPLSPTSN
jgi:murein DD-endopeptidase MepM/ murein hydrolase activator NlpD